LFSIGTLQVWQSNMASHDFDKHQQGLLLAAKSRTP